MTLIADAQQTITSTFSDGWDSSVAHAFENEKFDTENLAEYALVVVRHIPGGQHTLGQTGHRVYRRRGLVVVQIFTERDTGTARANALAAAAGALFEGKTIDQVAFTDANVVEVGPSEKWHQVNVTISFTYDEVK